MLDNNNKIDKEERKDANQVEQVNQVENTNVVEKKEKEKGKGTFYGIIAFAVFIIMAVGATFAYFTASTSSLSGSVRTGSTTLELDYISYESAWSADKLIPAYTNVVEYSVEKRPDDGSGRKMCIDDKGNEICSIYVFQVRNNAPSPQNVYISLQSEDNDFENLYAMLYRVYKGENYDDVNPYGADEPIFISSTNTTSGGECFGNNSCIQVVDGGNNYLFPKGDSSYTAGNDIGFEPVYINRLNVVKELQYVTTTETTGEEGNETTTTTTTPSVAVKVPAPGEESVRLSDAVVLHGVGEGEEIYNNYETFMIVLYIKDNNRDQNTSDGNKHFSGTVIVSGGDGVGGVTGRIGGLLEDDYTGLQSTGSPQSSQGSEQGGGGEEPSGGEPSGGEPNNEP